ncbi:MAG: glycosyltransferase family 2 protein [Terracidiphilus sp.]
MRISIVTISLNQRAYLQAAMESVLNQGYPELEYIVVDPGSSDGSRELIQRYADRIAHVIFEKDAGPADGLNKGFARASGEVFGFLNSDDLLEPGSLQAIGDYFTRHPECDIALGNGFVVDGEGRRIRHIRARSMTVRRYLHGGSRWMQQSTFLRKRSFQRLQGFNTQNRTSWDGELLVGMLTEGATVGYINTNLGCFRIHPASITGGGSNADAYQKDCARIFEQVTGRRWTYRDDLLRTLYRTENVLLRIIQEIGSRQEGR